jgi:hypothetical protein
MGEHAENPVDFEGTVPCYDPATVLSNYLS